MNIRSLAFIALGLGLLGFGSLGVLSAKPRESTLGRSSNMPSVSRLDMLQRHRMSPNVGNLAAWSQSGNYPYRVENAGAVALSGYVFILGGYSPDPGQVGLHNDVYSAAVNSDGSLQSWGSTTPFSIPRYLHSVGLDPTTRTIYVVGGLETTAGGDGITSVQYGHIVGPGSVGTWQAATPLPQPRKGHASFAYNGYLYVIGGQVNGAASNDILVSRINSDGSLGTWGQCWSGLADPAAGSTSGWDFLAATAYNGFAFAVGGRDPYLGVLDNAQSAPITLPGSAVFPLKPGDTGNWSTVPSLPGQRYFHACLADNGFIYAVGGSDGSSTLQSVVYAPIRNDGSLGAFAAATPLPVALERHCAVVHNGRLYTIGGMLAGIGNAPVYYAALNSADTTPPKTDISPAPGSYTFPLELTLTPADIGGSGISTTYYTLDGSLPTTSSFIYTGPITITGPTTLRFFSTDLAGNAEQAVTAQYSGSTGSASAIVWKPSKPSVVWDASSNYDERTSPIDSVVIHTTEGSTLQGAIDWMASHGTSAHYVIGPDGLIKQLVEDGARAWHATYYNARSIGIECVGFASDPSTWTPALWQSLVRLVAWLCAEYRIPAVHPAGDAIAGPLRTYSNYQGQGFKPAGIVAHSQIQKAGSDIVVMNGLASKSDPGLDWAQWAQLVQDVQKALTPILSSELPSILRISTGGVNVAGTTPAIAPDGLWVGFKNSPTYHMYDVLSDGIRLENADGAVTSGNGKNFSASFSMDGRFKAFASDDHNLVGGDTNGVSDVFVWDRETGVTERVSVSTAGAESDSPSYGAAISGDGRYVAFTSCATNLIAGDTNGVSDVFVHDRQTGGTTRVSVSSAGGEASGSSYSPSISADGRYVAFVSDATDLGAGDTNGVADIFVRDLQLGVTSRISVASDGGQANGLSRQPSISVDGRYVCFESDASTLVAGDTNGVCDIFLHDRNTGTTRRISVAPSGAQADGPSREPRISSYGLRIAFVSEASNLVAGETNGSANVFLAAFVPVQQGGSGATGSDGSGGGGGGCGLLGIELLLAYGLIGLARLRSSRAASSGHRE